jgi:hypothetical protein
MGAGIAWWIRYLIRGGIVMVEAYGAAQESNLPGLASTRRACLTPKPAALNRRARQPGLMFWLRRKKLDWSWTLLSRMSRS